MSGNSNNLIGKVGGVAATVSPADFAIGSPESRAAARAIAQKRRELSQEDEDCLTLYNYWPLINYRVAGNDAGGFRDSVKRGTEISKRRDGPVIPSHEDPHHQRMSTASIQFEFCYNREPVPGDILTREDVEARYSETMLFVKYELTFRPVWERRTPTAPFPFKIEDGKLWVLSLNDKQQEVWELNPHEDAEWNWKRVAEHALYGEPKMFVPMRLPSDEWKSVEAVKFVEPVNGKHTCKPCKASEQPPNTGYKSTVARIVEILDDARKRMSSAEIAQQLAE
jgi:hypothetical protein